MVKFTLFVSFLFVFFSAGVMGQYENCTGILDEIGDGKCDDYYNNNAYCGFDGGDCCECSCTNDLLNPCGIVGFNCSDPDIIGNERDCYDETAFVRHCASDATLTWLVNDTASAMSLAEAVNCSGGTFNVTWLGSVLVNRTLYIPNNTTLYVTGGDYGAEVNGGGKTRLFMAAGADLHIEGLVISNGNAKYGGAIAATRSSIFLNQTAFSGNTASSYGVAIMMSSFVSWDGETSFVGNTASDDGGALFVYSDSSIWWDGETSFVGNTAYDRGGGLYVFWDSSIAWDGETSFVGNIAKSSGGAIYVETGSNISVGGDTRFVDNEAGVDGGAALMYVGYGDVTFSYFMLRSNSAVLFHGNSCGGNGGAIAFIGEVVTRFSLNMTFVDNTAEVSGGAIYMSDVTIGIRFEGVIFRSNSAVLGGGLYSTGSGTAVTEDIYGNPEYNPTTQDINGNLA